MLDAIETLEGPGLLVKDEVTKLDATNELVNEKLVLDSVEELDRVLLQFTSSVDVTSVVQLDTIAERVEDCVQKRVVVFEPPTVIVFT